MDVYGNYCAINAVTISKKNLGVVDRGFSTVYI